MLIGSKDEFAIECYHEPDCPNDRQWIFGRMCIWCRGTRLGDLSESATLDVTAHQLNQILAAFETLVDVALDQMPDDVAFQFLDHTLYGDDDRSLEELVRDANRYRRHSFLISGGASLEHFKAFLVRGQSGSRLLYNDPVSGAGAARLPDELVRCTIETFLEWMSAERQRVPREQASAPDAT